MDTELLRDYNFSLKRFDTAKRKLVTDPRIPKHNREICSEWIDIKFKSLNDGKSKDQIKESAHRTAKTMAKYCTMLTNISYWFPDLRKIDEKELIKFKEDFLHEKITSVNGNILKEKNDYFKKVIRSEFFKKHLGYRDLVEKVFSSKLHEDRGRVQYITIEDLEVLIQGCKYDSQKAIFYLLFGTGVRVGTLLNLRVSDFELKHNQETHMNYYVCHIRKEYTKSNQDRSVPIVIPEANELLIKYFNGLDRKEFAVSNTYAGVRDLIRTTGEYNKITSKPDNKTLTPHLFRKACALFLLNQGYTLDQVKAFLGHKPSSDAIDAYANYSGLNLAPQVSKVQTDEFLKLKDKLKKQDLNMSVLLQKQDGIREEQKRNQEVILKLAKYIDDRLLAKDTDTLKTIYTAMVKKV